MARKNNTDALVAGALASFEKAATDLETAVKQYDQTAANKRSVANALLADASRAEVEADKASTVAQKIRALISA